MNIILFVSYLIFLILYIYLCKPHKFVWSLRYYSYIILALSYIIVPMLWYLLDIANSEVLSIYKESRYEIEIFTFITIVIGILVFTISSTYRDRCSYAIKINSRRLRYVLYFVSIISICSCLIVITAQGGIINAYANTIYIRSGYYISEFGHSSFLFYYRFIPLSIVAFFAFISLKDKILIDYCACLMCGIVGLIYCMILAGGRQNLIDVILTFIIARLVKRKKIFDKSFFILIILIIILLPFMKYWISGGVYFDRGTDMNIISSPITVLINEFSFIFKSLECSISEGQFNLFSDFAKSIYGSFLPSSWTPFDSPTSNYLNTLLLTGDKNVGYVPPGIIGQGYYSFGLIGVILIMSLTAKLFKWIDERGYSIIRINPNFSYVYIYAMMGCLSWLRTGLPSNYLYSPKFIIFICILLFCTKRCTKYK